MSDFSPSSMDNRARRDLERAGTLASKVLIFGISGLLAAGLLWSGLSEVEEVVTAPGRVEPSSRVQTINHPEGGLVEALHVEDGQSVRAGDLLVTFAPEMAEYARSEAETGYFATLATIARLEAELNGSELRLPDEVLAERPDLLPRERELMGARADNQAGLRVSLQRRIEARSSEVRRAESDVGRLESNLNLLNQQLAAISELAERGLYPKLKVLDMERQANDIGGERAKAQATLASLRSGLAQVQAEMDRLDKSWREELTTKLAEARTRSEQQQSQLAGRTTVLDGTVLRAPVDGIIQDLQITGEGQAVAANAPLMKLVPSGGNLVIKAQVANDDIGRVTSETLAAIKVHAFEFARFGALEGHVKTIAADATASGPQDQPTYAVTIEASTSYLAGDPKLAILPGMLVDVELVAGKRTILSYFTDTLVTYREKAFKEG